MLDVREIIVVEGKYDKNKLAGFIRGTILETSGFGIYHDPALRNLLRTAAEKRGIIVLTDSDSAGFQIRRYLRSFIPEEKIRDVYVPALQGKERRKAHPSKEHILGVEGLSEEILIESLRKYGVDTGPSAAEKEDPNDCIRTIDLYRLGLSGKSYSRKKMVLLLKYLDLPEGLSTKEACEVLNLLTTKEELVRLVQALPEPGKETPKQKE